MNKLVRSKLCSILCLACTLLSAIPASAYKLPPVGTWSCWDACIEAEDICWQGCAPDYALSCVEPCQQAWADCVRNNCGLSNWFVAFRPLGGPQVLNASIGQIQSGYGVQVCWFDSLNTPVVPSFATVDSVVFLAVRQSDFAATWAMNPTLPAVEFTRLGLGTPDALPFAERPGAPASTCTGYSLTLPNVFQAGTAYYLMAYVTDSSISPDGRFLAMAPLVVAAEPVPALTTWGAGVLGLVLLVGLIVGRRRVTTAS